VWGNLTTGILHKVTSKLVQINIIGGGCHGLICVRIMVHGFIYCIIVLYCIISHRDLKMGHSKK